MQKTYYQKQIESAPGEGNNLCPPPSVILSEAKNLFLRTKDIHHELIIRLLPRLTLSINRRKYSIRKARTRFTYATSEHNNPRTLPKDLAKTAFLIACLS